MRIELSKLLASDSPAPSDCSSDDFVSARVSMQLTDNAYCNRAAGDQHAGEYLALENSKMARPPGKLEIVNSQRPPGEWRHPEENEYQSQQVQIMSNPMMGGTWPMVGQNCEQMMWFIHPWYTTSL
jgi:hypothetical protein